jgi:hypothetical protein
MAGSSVEHWLAALRDGSEAEKREARWRLSLIFEERGQLEDATEILEGNVWAGVRDATTYRRLASLYRRLGRQDLADQAIAEAFRLNSAGGPRQEQVSPAPQADSLLARPRMSQPVSVPPSVPPALDVTLSDAHGEMSRTAAPSWRRTRPAWLLVMLMFTTFGLYSYYWLFATWRELKKELDDPTMYPFWHTVAITVVPIYSLFRFHAHMRTIRELVSTAGKSTTLSPGLCVIVGIITSAMGRASLRASMRQTDLPIWFDLVATVLDTTVVIWAQSALNIAWHALPHGAPLSRVHPGEWIVMTVGSMLWVLVIIGSFNS